MIKMTYNDAMTIQRAQLAYYRQHIGRAGVKAIRRATKTDPNLNPEEPISVLRINELVPRGGQFERYCHPRKPGSSDPTNYDLHNAIRRGIL